MKRRCWRPPTMWCGRWAQLISIWWRSESGGSGRQKYKNYQQGKNVKWKKRRRRKYYTGSTFVDFSSAPPPISLSFKHTRTHTQKEGDPAIIFFPSFFLLRRSTCEPPHHSKKGSMWVLIGSCHSRGRHHQKNKTSTICRRRRRSRPFLTFQLIRLLFIKGTIPLPHLMGGLWENKKKVNYSVSFSFSRSISSRYRHIDIRLVSICLFRHHYFPPPHHPPWTREGRWMDGCVEFFHV